MATPPIAQTSPESRRRAGTEEEVRAALAALDKPRVTLGEVAHVRVYVVALVFVLAAVPVAAHAQPSTPELIERAEASGLVDRHRADLFRAYALARPGRLPARFRSDAPWDGTPVLLRLRRDLPGLRSAERQEVEGLLVAAGPGEDCDNEGSAQGASTRRRTST